MEVLPHPKAFNPCAAAEIDSVGRVLKVALTAPDYCSCTKDADNSTVTLTRLLEALTRREQALHDSRGICENEGAKRPNDRGRVGPSGAGHCL